MMRHDQSRLWRFLFVVGGALYLAGSTQHPRGEMKVMLADPAWRAGHATILVGLLVLVVGLVLFRRSRPASASLDRWLGLGVIVTALEAFEMAVHTIANVDANALMAGHATPVLTTHLWLATLIYPLFGVVMLGLMWVGQRERSLGSPWINWLGMAGAVAHGIVMPLVFLLEVPGAALLFPIAAITLSIWFILAGVWPSRSAAASGVATPGGLVGAR